MLPNSFIKKFSWVLLFSMLFSLVSILPEEPAYAAGEFACFDSNGAAYAYHMEFSGSNVTVYKWNVAAGSYTTAETFNLGSLTGTTDQINGHTMDGDGNMYVIYQPTSGNKRLVKLNYVDGNGGSITDMGEISSSSSGDVNAGSYIEHGGSNYIVFSKGMGDGGRYYVQLSNSTTVSASGTWSQSSSFNDGANKKQAKDFAWIKDGLTIGSDTYNLVGVDLKNDAVILGKWAGPSSTVELVDYDIDAKPSSWNSSDTVGAMYGFGGSVIYASNNQEGEMGELTWDGSAFDITYKGESAASTNNDGAACHSGDPTLDFNPTVSAAEGSCSGSNREVDVTLTNTASEMAATFVVTYTLDGASPVTLTSGSGQSVSSGASNTSLTIPAQSNGTAVVVSWYAENDTYDTRKPTTGTTTLSTITIDTSSCAQGTVSTGLGSCSNGAATSTIVLTATNATMYFDVQYQINSDGWVTLKNDEAVSPGSPETYATPAQADGTTVSWRYETGTSAPSSGSYTSATSRTVDCDLTVTVSTQINSCSNGTATTTVTFVGSASGNTQYYDLQRREDGGSWSDVVNGESIAAGETNTHTSSAFNDGTLVEWQYRIGDSNPSSGSYTTTGTGSGTLTQRTIDCDITFTISTSINSCSSGAATVSIEFAASAAGNTQYFDVEWSTDQSSWTSLVDGGDLTAGDTDTYTTTAVDDGVTVYFHYRHGDSNPSSGSWLTTNVTNRTIDCDITFTIDTSINSCSSGAATVSIEFAASASGNTQYFDVQWSTDQSSWTNLADGGDLTAGDTDTYTTTAVDHEETVYFQYRHADSNPSSGSWLTTNVTNRTIDCPTDCIFEGTTAFFLSPANKNTTTRTAANKIKKWVLLIPVSPM